MNGAMLDAESLHGYAIVTFAVTFTLVFMLMLSAFINVKLDGAGGAIFVAFATNVLIGAGALDVVDIENIASSLLKLSVTGADEDIVLFTVPELPTIGVGGIVVVTVVVGIVVVTVVAGPVTPLGGYTMLSVVVSVFEA